MNYTQKLTMPIIGSLFAFFMAALLGLSMRWAFVVDFPEWFEYRNIEHAHSHVALLGWLHSIFIIGIIYFFQLDWGRYRSLFWWMMVSVVGMIATFPIVGYAPIPIAFTVVHMILSYVVAYRIFRELREKSRRGTDVLFLKASLFFMILSTLGTWVLGPIIATGLKGSAFYYGAIQFYLHFQFNGWFVFALLAILFKLLKQHDIYMNVYRSQRLFIVLFISTILTYALAVTWSTPYLSIFLINSTGVIMQLLGFSMLYWMLYQRFELIKKAWHRYAFSVFMIAALALGLKVLIQTMVAIPAVAEISYTIHNFVIGFIHLLMLGSLSLFAFGAISLVITRPLHSWGTWLFIIGIVITEAALFIQGIMLWQEMGFMPRYYLVLAIGSSIILLGLCIVMINVIMKRSLQSF